MPRRRPTRRELAMTQERDRDLQELLDLRAERTALRSDNVGLREVVAQLRAKVATTEAAEARRAKTRDLAVALTEFFSTG